MKCLGLYLYSEVCGLMKIPDFNVTHAILGHQTGEKICSLKGNDQKSGYN